MHNKKDRHIVFFYYTRRGLEFFLAHVLIPAVPKGLKKRLDPGWMELKLKLKFRILFPFTESKAAPTSERYVHQSTARVSFFIWVPSRTWHDILSISESNLIRHVNCVRC